MDPRAVLTSIAALNGWWVQVVCILLLGLTARNLRKRDKADRYLGRGYYLLGIVGVAVLNVFLAEFWVVDPIFAYAFAAVLAYTNGYAFFVTLRIFTIVPPVAPKDEKRAYDIISACLSSFFIMATMLLMLGYTLKQWSIAGMEPISGVLTLMGVVTMVVAMGAGITSLLFGPRLNKS